LLAAHFLQLAMRIGLHSGPITAGVLRGDNARYQLFGDVTKFNCICMLQNLMP